jgi:hypothetical protein
MKREIMRSLVPADMQDIAKAPRGQHADLGAIVLDGDVGRHGGAMGDNVDLIGRNIRDSADLLHPCTTPIDWSFRVLGTLW